ncbi:mechanosensitive ion channel [Acinetobacter qingfengensis]|uniref:Small-conductance mechanosensitive channel n=1 Tax=Acinetobacter qingfengensis TaxID=1262585 RepID=A0A1E7RDE5_9GAMM|nr:mechanosensitive ion channel [Acinetobacter qingfengensis]KAA8734449.1 mechanosensitive ion channel [Acinetobacter qingfengensis]OEY97361.1 hypothetical protein BJI46_10265 [Acinetobacter qingfengensis]
MNNGFGMGNAPQRFDLYYFWDQFHPVLGAVVIFIVGWIIALLVSGGIKKLLATVHLNQKVNQSTQSAASPDVEQILARIVFWFILIIAIVAGLNVLNLHAVSAPFSNMIGEVLAFIPTLIAAVVVALVGWLAATLARTGLNKALARTQLDEKLSQDVGVAPLSQNIAEIVYWLILLLFLPIVLSILGLNGLLAPVQVMLTDAISYIPNLFIAGIIVFAGYILAKILRGIVEGLVNSVGLQTQAEKIGVFKSTNLGKLLGSFVFAVVIITALIIAFDALGVETISQPATAMLNQFLLAIPNILAAVVILIIAYVVAKFVGKLATEILAGTGVDELPEKVDLQRFLGTQKISAIIGCLIVFFTMLFAISEAANRLGFHQVSELIAIFIAFGAQILLGAVILVIGFWLANAVANVVQRGEYKSSRWLATLIRVLVMGLVLAMGLRAMGIADSIVNLAFGLTLGGVAVAFALAFGLGGRQPAERILTKLIDKAEKEACEPNPQQPSASDAQVNLPVGVENINLHPEDPVNPVQDDLNKP